MIAFDDIRTWFAMRRLDLEAVALELVRRDRFESRVQRLTALSAESESRRWGIP